MKLEWRLFDHYWMTIIIMTMTIMTIIINEDFMTIINEEKKYRELKESIRMMNSQRSDVEKISLIEEGKKNRY